MQFYNKLSHFPLGAIQAEGFLRQQLQRGKDGICAHLHELEPEMINDPYIKKSRVSAWHERDQAGWGGEISGNYWTGYIQFAFTLGDAEMIKTATEWVNEMLKRRKPDGYLGTYDEAFDNIYEDYNAWGTASVMRGLIAFYEATGRPDVLDAVHKCMLWFCDKWSGDRKTSYSGPFIIEPMIAVYRYTEDYRLVEFAEEYLEYLCRNDIFRTSYKSMLYDEYQYNTNHTAGMGCQIRLPALVYSATGKEDYLKASERKINQILEKSVQLSGGPVSVTEYLAPIGSTTETEYCCYAFYNATYSCLGEITGNTKYGDLMEQMFYNGVQGARKKDERAIAYFNSPNQIYATETSSPAVRDRQAYAPCYPVACCPVNAVVVVPEFIRGMLLRDESDNVYVMAYGPCSLNYNDISITEITNYPFRNNIVFEVNCSKLFTFNLKIPAGCKGYEVKINGEKTKICAGTDGYVAINRAWCFGDTVEISFKAEIEIIKVDDSDFAAKHPIAIKYGALLFAYHIPEIWEPIEGSPMTKLPDGWSWFNVKPKFTEPEGKDHYIVTGLKRNYISWNIALDENLCSDDIEIDEIDSEEYPWVTPMIKLHTHCYKAPYLCSNYPHKTFEPYGEYQYVTEKLPLTLEPYGCTNLRITYFPKADLKSREK